MYPHDKVYLICFFLSFIYFTNHHCTGELYDVPLSNLVKKSIQRYPPNYVVRDQRLCKERIQTGANLESTLVNQDSNEFSESDDEPLSNLLKKNIQDKGQSFWKTTQFKDNKPREKQFNITWCTISKEEHKKCLNFAMANERDQIKVGYERAEITCKSASTKDECMQLLDEGNVTMTTLDAGSVYVGGRYHSLVPIAQEVLQGGFKFYYGVAVIKKGTLDGVNSLHHLRGKKACFAGVQTFAGWVLPISTLMKDGGMEIIDCNNHVKTATNYFGPSCAVNCLSDKYNPIGDNSDKLCQLCIGKIPGGRCTDSDPYAGYEGAFRCLLEAGDIAFVKHNTVPELITGMEYAALSPDHFELLCKDGSRRPMNEYLSCNWGKVPSDAVVVSSAVPFEKREKFQMFLQKFAEKYPKRSNVTVYSTHNTDIYGTKRPEYDQYGNRIQSQYNQFGSRNRYRRQNFGDFGNSGPNRSRYNENRNSQGNYYNEDYNSYNTDTQYGNYPYVSDNNPRDRDRFNQNDYNRDQTTESHDNPFARDPYSLNPVQYGVNIDPYETDTKNIQPSRAFEDNDINNNAYNHTNTTFYEVFSLFESSLYGIHGNLLFQDATVGLAPVPESQQTYSSFLGESLKIVTVIRSCPVKVMTLCVTSDAEKNKCVKMRTALKAQLLEPEMGCYKGHSQINCMEAIRNGTADVAILDASDIYTAGLHFDLVPFISEIYDLDEPGYYVVAVAKESDPTTELTYLKNKNTCHGGINTAAGWVYPLAFLISNGWIRPYGCNSIRAAAEYFSKSCVPGALSTEYNTGVPYDNMCDLCHGSSFRYCRRDASEDYYGHTGAFRCLVEGGGQVAFVKHTTVTENTGGKKREWWARDNLNDDFELLCPDGTRAEINEYKRCNLGKVKANAIVTRGGYEYNEKQINAYINLFMYAQTHYGRISTDEFSFSMFSSAPPYADLIFQDATTQLKVIEPSKRYYSKYLGSDFMRARRIVDCHAGTNSLSTSLATVLLSIFLTVIIRK